MAFLTDDQFEALKEFISASIDDVIIEKKLVTKFDIKHLPTKDEFYEKMAEITGKLDQILKENSILNDRTSTNRDRIETLESIHPQNKHSFS